MAIEHPLKKSAAIILCASFVMCALVLLPAGRVSAAPTDAWIEGTVTDGVNPIENAFVVYILTMSGGGPQGTTWTDASGYYNFTVRGGLDYGVIIVHGDYYTSMGMTSIMPGETKVLDIVMTTISPAVPDVTFTGYLLDELGNPVADADVAGMIDDTSGGDGPPKYANMTKTDVDGKFSVNVIPSTGGGGVGAFIPGYPMPENKTDGPLVSGNTYWLNLTLQAEVSTDDAFIYGYVTDALDNPLENAMVSFQSWNQWNQGSGEYSNITYTDSSGYYEMNVTNGSSEIFISLPGYSIYLLRDFQVDPSDVLQIDASLRELTATVSGVVTDLSTTLPIANARVFLMDGPGMGNISMATTDGTGAYVLGAFSGTDLSIGAEQDGYSRNWTSISISPGDDLTMDFGLWPVDSWLTGKVTDYFTGLPIQGASVWVNSPIYSEWTSTNATGDYNISLVSGEYTVEINSMNYMRNSSTITVAPGGNVHDVELIPSNVPETTKLHGIVHELSNPTAVISNAEVRVGVDLPEFNGSNQTDTDGSGYFEIWAAPLPLYVLVKADGYMHWEAPIDATGLTDIMLDVGLVPDPWGPNQTYDQDPVENISWTNPTMISAMVEDMDLEQLSLWYLKYDVTMGSTDYYYAVQTQGTTFNPFDYLGNPLPYTQMGEQYFVNLVWDGTVMGGYLHDGMQPDKYLASYEFWMGPTAYDAVRGFYSNSTIISPEPGTAWFDRTTGVFVFFTFDDGMYPNADPSDPSGSLWPAYVYLYIDTGTGSWGVASTTWEQWGSSTVQFISESAVPSGDYLSLFVTSDFGGRYQFNMTEMTVDNNLPVANAGPGQEVIQNLSATLDGSGSSDNVGIVDYEWRFDDGGLVVLDGAVVSYNFTTVGNHTVTLYVTDGAGHVSQADTWVNVTADQHPDANAGTDQTVLGGQEVWLDGSLSTDDVDIVNWTWTFMYEGNPVELWGEVVSYTFWTEGTYLVTLTVTDSAGQKSADTVEITVSGMIPEFPTLLLPVLGLLAIVVAVRFRNARKN